MSRPWSAVWHVLMVSPRVPHSSQPHRRSVRSQIRRGRNPGATVTATNVGTNAQRTTVTDDEGGSIPARIGHDHIKVTEGFRTAELPAFVLAKAKRRARRLPWDSRPSLNRSR